MEIGTHGQRGRPAPLHVAMERIPAHGTASGLTIMVYHVMEGMQRHNRVLMSNAVRTYEIK